MSRSIFFILHIKMKNISFYRGKHALGYSDSELANMGGYDLVHYDDLAYVASAHQESELISAFLFGINICWMNSN